MEATIEAVREAPETPEWLNIRLEEEEDGGEDSNSASVLLNEAVREAIVKAREFGEQQCISESQALREELVLRLHALRVAEEAALDRDALCDRVAELEIAKSNLSTTTAESHAARMGMEKKLDEVQAQLHVVMKENASLMKALNKEAKTLTSSDSYELISSAPASPALPCSFATFPIIDQSTIAADANANKKVIACRNHKGRRSVSLSPRQSLGVNNHYYMMANGRDDVPEKELADVLPFSINPKVEQDDSVKLKLNGQACSVSVLPPKDVDQKRILELEQRLEESNLAVSRLEAEVKALATQDADGVGPEHVSEQQQPYRQSSTMKQHHHEAVKTDHLVPINGGGGETALIRRLLPPPVRVKHRSFCADDSPGISEGHPLKMRSASSSREKQKPKKRRGRLTITLGRSNYLQDQNPARNSRLSIRDEVL